MIIGRHNTDEKVFIIAEIGNNHEGNFSFAQDMVGLAHESGADAVKFQTIVPEALVASDLKEQIEKFKRFQLSYAQFERLASQAESLGMIFLSTPFDLESADALEPFVPAFKVASGDNNFYPLLTHLARKGKPILMSSGMTDLPELRRSIAMMEQAATEGKTVLEVAILHCVSSYPTLPKDAHLNSIVALKESLPYTIGYSDHTLGIRAAVLSVALGARIIEKHFTADKHHSTFRDHELSADPTELKELVERVREAEIYLGAEGAKATLEAEANVKKVARRSIALKRSLPKGHQLTQGDITWLRPGLGFPPGSEAEVVGKTLNQDVVAGKILTPDMLA